MRIAVLATLGVALLATFIALGVWAATDRHSYTKFEVVEQVEAQASEDDPFAGTGFYEEEDGSTARETVKRDEFHLGLVPTPQGLFDKHMISVATIAAPFWALFVVALVAMWWMNRRGRAPVGKTSNA